METITARVKESAKQVGNKVSKAKQLCRDLVRINRSTSSRTNVPDEDTIIQNLKTRAWDLENDREYTKAGHVYMVICNHEKDISLRAATYMEAARCFERGNAVNSAIDSWVFALELWKVVWRAPKQNGHMVFMTRQDRHVALDSPLAAQKAGECHQYVAIYQEEKSVTLAIKNYKDAAIWYRKSTDPHREYDCLLRAANLAIQEDDFNDAIHLYERVASEINRELYKPKLRDCLNKAALCHMLGRYKPEMYLQKYDLLLPGFSESEGYKAVDALCVSARQSGREFRKHVEKWNMMFQTDVASVIIDRLL